jgi:hypothetical protein
MRRVAIGVVILCVALLVRAADQPAGTRLLLPLGRSAYQTNEMIDVSVVREGKSLPAGELKLTLAGKDGSKITAEFPVKASPAGTTEHLQINGWLLRPGEYTITANVDGHDATAAIDVHSHIRQSTFKTIDWGSRASGKQQRLLGEDGLGFNLLYYAYGGLEPNETIRAGIDYMRVCAMSGGHQMDLRSECDWSDPYTLQGAAARVARQALEDRTHSNCIGVHFYDEPGLTWWKHSQTGVPAPYNVPAQDRSYRAAFGHDAPQYNDIKPDDSAAIERWMDYSIWRLSILEAAWKQGILAVNDVRPDYLTATQSMYGFGAYGDGYYFNVARPFPVLSGHGGYDDGPAGYFFPSFHLEFGRIRDGTERNKPEWYLPSWYRMTPENYRLEQYLPFMMHVQGLAKPPDLLAHDPAQTPEEAGIVEANKLTARLGTIFTTMPLTRPPVAQLFSLSQNLSAEVRDMQDPKKMVQSAYDGGGHSRAKSLSTYLAGKMIHIPFMPIVEEDILDGTLAANHRAVILPGINYLEPNVIAALEQFITGGGTVLVSDDSQVQIKGATKIGAAASSAQDDLVARLWRENKIEESKKVRGASAYLKDAEPFAKAVREQLAKIGITAPMECDQPAVVTSRQALGDVEYLFATNATPDEKSDKPLAIKPTVATLSLPNDGRPIYDAIRGKSAAEFAVKDKALSATIRFGAGQMRAFARTARPIGAVQVNQPMLTRDYTATENPVHIEFSAMVLDNAGKPLIGSIPLQVKLIDPLGESRYDLYRATDKGSCRIDLPLAANDPPGEWKVIVRELLNDTEGSTTFQYAAPSQVGAIVGVRPRALMFGDDRHHVFRFFRTFENVSIVAGNGDYSAAVDRIVTSLKPWDIHCKVVPIAEASKPRALSPEESSTWVGLVDGVRKDQKNPPTAQAVGFAVQGPVILLGTPEDNVLIKFAVEHKFLPYMPDAQNVPGRGRGMVAWQRDLVGYQQQSITLIGYDADGIGEAIGTMCQAAAGQEPLMSLAPPTRSSVAPATRAEREPSLNEVWRIALPDRAVALQSDAKGIVITTADGSRFTVDSSGHMTGREDASDAQINPKNEAPKLPEPISKASPPALIAKRVAAHGDRTFVAYWGGTVLGFDAGGKSLCLKVFPQDVAEMSVQGDLLIVGLADGEVIALKE